jgi:hypothetical protein
VQAAGHAGILQRASTGYAAERMGRCRARANKANNIDRLRHRMPNMIRWLRHYVSKGRHHLEPHAEFAMCHMELKYTQILGKYFDARAVQKVRSRVHDGDMEIAP